MQVWNEYIVLWARARARVMYTSILSTVGNLWLFFSSSSFAAVATAADAFHSMIDTMW